MKRFVYFTMVLLFIGCANAANKGKKEVASRSVTTLFRSTDSKSCLKDGIYTIDVNKKYPKKRFKLEELADIKYIPLETTDSVLWSGYEICSIHENLIIGADARSGDVKFHDAEGHFLSSFNHKGNGKAEYSYLSGFCYDQKKDEVFILDAQKGRAFVYNKQGDFKRSFYSKCFDNAEKRHVLESYKLRNLNEDELLSYTTRNHSLIMSKKNGGKLKKFDLSGERRISLFIHVKTSEGKSAHIKAAISMFAREKEGYMVASFPLDTIYHITDSKRDIQPVFVRRPPIADMEVPIFLLTELCTPEYYFMCTVKKEYDKEKKTGFENVDLMVDKKSGQVYEYTLKHSDWIRNSWITELLNAREHDLPSGTFTKLLNAFQLRKAYKENKLSGELKVIASKLTDDDNPVLMIGTFK